MASDGIEVTTEGDPDRPFRRFVLPGLLSLAGALVLAASVVAWVKVPDLYPPSTNTKETTLLAAQVTARSQAITTTRASVLAALAGLGALVTIVINYRNSRTNLRNAQTAIEGLAVTNQTFRIQQRGHLTDRYTKAIEQLGNAESIAIRLGGIYALEQLAVDTDRPGDQSTVVEVLSAFFRHEVENLLVRESPFFRNAMASPLVEKPPPADASDVSVKAVPSRNLPNDVLAALSVLSRLPHREGVDRADLGEAAQGSYLSPALKPGANLTAAELTGADLTGAHLIGAHLNGADLTRARFTYADLTDAHLISANLPHADLTGANLTGANLNRAHLTGADLTGAHLTGAHLNTNLALARLAPEQLTVEQRRSAASLPPGWPQEPDEAVERGDIDRGART